jgi:hypothetical protein
MATGATIHTANGLKVRVKRRALSSMDSPRDAQTVVVAA